MLDKSLIYSTILLISFLSSAIDPQPIESNQTNKKSSTLSSSSNETKEEEDSPLLNVLWTSIKRQSNKTDLIRPSLCPSPCNRLFKARKVEQLPLGMDDREPTQEELCYCRCPTELPVFHQSVGQCVAKIDDCKRPIRVASTSIDPNSQWAQVVSLPKQADFVRFPGLILWQESRVKLKPKQGPRCNITKVKVLRQDRQWIDSTNVLFHLGWSDEMNSGSVLWNGTEDTREGLLGSLVQIQMNCVGAEQNAHCLTMRVAGELIFPDYTHQPYLNGGQNRVETVVIILLAILLFFTSFGYLILWKVRWRIKKSKLISALQMQFLYHMKQEKEKASEAAAHQHHYQVFANANPPLYPHQMHPHHQQPQKSPIYTTNDLTIESQAEMMMGIEQQAPNPALIAKRKLYFSAEFFEPHLMQNPPPMADQFLQDLRKMIEIAKQRINLRKHVQHLQPIAEESPEIYQAYMQKPIKEPLSVTSTSNIHLRPTKNEESSPKSIKSIDSGHESSSSNESKKNEANGSGLKLKSDSNGKSDGGEFSEAFRPRLNSNSSTNNKQSQQNNTPKLHFDDHHERPSTLQINQTSSIQHEFKRPNMEPPRKITHVSTPNVQNGVQVQQQQQQQGIGSLTPPTSRIPTMNGLSFGQKSPRPTVKQPLSLTNHSPILLNGQQRSPQRLSPKANDDALPPPLPPRNPPTTPPKNVQQFIAQANRTLITPNNNTTTQSRPITTTNIQHHSEPIQQQQSQIQPPSVSKTAEARRKAYAVFPQDAMLKKSLPRRSKKPTNKPGSNATSTKNGFIETDM